MADDRSNPGAQDRARIDVNQDNELRDWSRRFGVSEDELKGAVETVGPMSDDVEGWLKRRPKGPKRMEAGSEEHRIPGSDNPDQAL